MEEEDQDFVNADLSFVCKAVIDFTEMAELMPEPQPPAALGKGGETVYNKRDKGYIAQMNQYNLRQLA